MDNSNIHFDIIWPVSWDKKSYQCSGGTCPLWEDDDMLLDEDQRDARPIAPLIPVIDMEMEPSSYDRRSYFDWIYDEGEFRLV